jgi:hypothetical protein
MEIKQPKIYTRLNNINNEITFRVEYNGDCIMGEVWTECPLNLISKPENRLRRKIKKAINRLVAIEQIEKSAGLSPEHIENAYYDKALEGLNKELTKTITKEN